VVVEQLVELTRSIGDLVRQNAAGTGSATAAAAADDPAQRARVVFAYDFLGVVLGRRAPSVFQLTLVGVTRESGRLTFTGLKGATAARVRSARNQVRLLEGLADGQPVRIDQAPNAIDDAARIDSIVTFTVAGGVPVALGPCLDPVDGIVTG
jgi:hypothetical protein